MLRVLVNLSSKKSYLNSLTVLGRPHHKVIRQNRLHEPSQRFSPNPALHFLSRWIYIQVFDMSFPFSTSTSKGFPSETFVTTGGASVKGLNFPMRTRGDSSHLEL